MSSFSGNTPPFLFSSDYDYVLFNADNTAKNSTNNIQVYPYRLQNKTFYLLNPNSSTIGEKANGSYVTGWTPGNINLSVFNSIVNGYPRHMFKNLLMVAGEDGIPIPIAGTYFTKLLSHTPGTATAGAALILNNDGSVDQLTITGNLNLSGSGAALTAINTFGKTNEIDCGYINDEDLE